MKISLFISFFFIKALQIIPAAASFVRKAGTKATEFGFADKIVVCCGLEESSD